MDEHLAHFWDHIEDLRWTLVRSVLVVSLGFVFLLMFYQPILKFLSMIPVEQTKPGLTQQKIEQYQISNQTTQSQYFELPVHARLISDEKLGGGKTQDKRYLLAPGESVFYEQVNQPALLIMGPIEGMSLVLKTCLWLSLALTSPVWGWVWLQFVLPALRKNERMVLYPFLILSLLFLAMGGAIAYYVTLPIANHYLLYFNNSIGQNAWTFMHYMDYLLFLCLGHAVAAELALLLFILVHFRFLSADWLAGKRRHMIVSILVLSALLTPPDVLTQLFLAIPLIGVYEVAIQYAKWRKRMCPSSCDTCDISNCCGGRG